MKQTNSLKDTSKAQEEIDSLTNPTSIKEIKVIVKNFPTKITPGHIYTFSFRKQKSPEHSYEATITSIAKPKTLQAQKINQYPL